ncbi:MAG: hypothetical protein V3W50_01715 [Thermoanaerobaculia bacterium]
MKWVSRVVAVLFLLLLAVPSGGHELEAYTLLSVAPVDGKAVIQLPEGELQVLALGETVPGTNSIIRQVLPDRLVLDETVVGDEADDTTEWRTVWLFKAQAPGQKSRLQVLSRTAPDEPEVLAPNSAVEESRAPPEKTDPKKEEEEGGSG